LKPTEGRPDGGPHLELDGLRGPVLGDGGGEVHEAAQVLVEKPDEIELDLDSDIFGPAGGKNHLFLELTGHRFFAFEEKGPVHSGEPRVHVVGLRISGAQMERKTQRERPVGQRGAEPEDIGRAEVLIGLEPGDVNARQPRLRHPIDGELHLPQVGHLTERRAACEASRQKHEPEKRAPVRPRSKHCGTAEGGPAGKQERGRQIAPMSPGRIAGFNSHTTNFSTSRQMRKLSWDEIERPDPEDVAALPKHPVRLVVHNVRSIHNVGAMFRTSDAARIEHVHLTGFTGTPEHKDLHKTALGAQDTVAWSHHDEAVPLLHDLQAAGYTIAALEQADRTRCPDEVAAEAFPLALVVGNEVRGIDEEVLDAVEMALEIPQYGAKISLNVGVAYGIAVYDLIRRYRTTHGPPDEEPRME